MNRPLAALQQVMFHLHPLPWRLARCAASLALAALLVLAAATPTAAEEPPATPTPVAAETTPPSDPGADDAGGGPLSFLPDPRQWVAEIFQQALVALLQAVAGMLHSVVSGVTGSALNVISHTPPEGSYASPTVLALWSTVRAIANAALALVALSAGFHLMIRPHLGAPYHEARELLPRLALGALLANTSLAWAQLAIDANNALCQAVGQASLPAWERADTASQLLADVLATLIYLVTSLLLVLQMLLRLALLDVLIVVAPLALLCGVLPETAGWTRLWTGLFLSTVFVQFVQVLALKLGGALLTELTPLAPDATVLALFLGVAVLILTLKIPDLMRAQAGDGLGFARYYAYRRGAQLLDGGRSRGAGGGRGGA